MNQDHTKWTELLDMAVKQPGVLMKAYSAFHGYSLGNQVLAMVQCQMRYVELKINDTKRRAIVLQLSSIPVFDHKPNCPYREAEFF
jgi:hypothetical protein